MIENNSKEMKTVVETYLVEETVDLIYDNDKLEKWNKHITELGLTGQAKIVKKDKSPIPFMHMKSTVRNVFETLCPRKVKVEEYDISPIPVEILDLIALSKKEQYFDRLEIWYDDKNLDPACIGFLFNTPADKASGYMWNGQYYLLGKWGDVKASFETLKERAICRFKKERSHELSSNIKMYQRLLEDVGQEAINKFGVENESNSDILPF